MKAENFHPPREDQIAAGESFDANCHGKNGSVQVGSRDTKKPYSPIMMALMHTVKKMGVSIQRDLSCGDPRGVSMLPNSVTKEQERSDAGRTWLSHEVINRKNLDILVGQWAGKVLIHPKEEKTRPRAYGVEFGLHESHKYEVYANHEVLLAAGSSVSPLILEYSGIGMKNVLEKVHVDQIVDLPVGVNMQDQTTTSIRNTIKNGDGQGQAAYFATFEEIFPEMPEREAALKMLEDKTLQKWANDVVSRGGFHDAKLLMEQYTIQANQIKSNDVAYSELFLDTYGSIHFDLWTLLPFSRGYIHIRNADPYFREVDNDPQYFTNELDTLAQAASTRLARKLSSAGEMKKYWAAESVPGYHKVPKEATLQEWVKYVKGNYRANYHAIGTASMMSQKHGGVVDNKARVYGVDGLRVIDGSIVPMQISSHVMTVFYGMALKIAESVIEDWKAQQDKPSASEEEVPAVGTLRTTTEVDLQGLGEGEGPGHVGLAAVSGFDGAEAQSVLDD